MTAAAAAAAPDDRADPLAAFELRCWARAKLVAEGELSMSEAVDELQAAALRDGLIDKLGQDAVQQIMAREFAEVMS